MPRAVVIARLDHQRADFDGEIAACQEAFGAGVLPLYLPADGGQPRPRRADHPAVLRLLQRLPAHGRPSRTRPTSSASTRPATS